MLIELALSEVKDKSGLKASEVVNDESKLVVLSSKSSKGKGGRLEWGSAETRKFFCRSLPSEVKSRHFQVLYVVNPKRSIVMKSLLAIADRDRFCKTHIGRAKRILRQFRHSLKAPIIYVHNSMTIIQDPSFSNDITNGSMHGAISPQTPFISLTWQAPLDSCCPSLRIIVKSNVLT